MIDAEAAPFERILGDTCELRVAEKLLAMPDFEFSVSELARSTGLSRPSIYAVIRGFDRWGIVHRLDRGKRPRYRVNLDSNLVQSLYEFNHELVYRVAHGTDASGELATEVLVPEPRIDLLYLRRASAFIAGTETRAPDGIAAPKHPAVRAVA